MYSNLFSGHYFLEFPDQQTQTFIISPSDVDPADGDTAEARQSLANGNMEPQYPLNVYLIQRMLAQYFTRPATQFIYQVQNDVAARTNGGYGKLAVCIIY